MAKGATAMVSMKKPQPKQVWSLLGNVNTASPDHTATSSDIFLVLPRRIQQVGAQVAEAHALEVRTLQEVLKQVPRQRGLTRPCAWLPAL